MRVTLGSLDLYFIQIIHKQSFIVILIVETRTSKSSDVIPTKKNNKDLMLRMDVVLALQLQ